MDNFPPNSKSGRGPNVPNEPKKVERVTSAEAVRRKRSLGRRFKETIFVGGDARSTWDYVFVDVIVPTIRDLFVDSIEAALHRRVYGDARPRPRSGGPPTGYPNAGHIDYSRISRGPATAERTSAPQRMLSRQSRARGSFDEILIPTRPDAEEVLDQMFDILSKYGQVSVADLLTLVGLASTHTDVKWGWISLTGAKAVPQRRQGGFILDLPEPIPFD